MERYWQVKADLLERKPVRVQFIHQKSHTGLGPNPSFLKIYLNYYTHQKTQPLIHSFIRKFDHAWANRLDPVLYTYNNSPWRFVVAVS